MVEDLHAAVVTPFTDATFRSSFTGLTFSASRAFFTGLTFRSILPNAAIRTTTSVTWSQAINTGSATCAGLAFGSAANRACGEEP